MFGLLLRPIRAVYTCRCLYEAWQTGRKGKGKLVMLSYGTKFEPLEKVRG